MSYTTLVPRSITRSINVNNMVEDAAAGLRAEITSLNEKLVKVEKHASPTYVVNRRTGRWRQIFSAFADCGVEAMADCGCSYALPTARVRFATIIPEDIFQHDICKPCLGIIRPYREPRVAIASGLNRAPAKS